MNVRHPFLRRRLKKFHRLSSASVDPEDMTQKEGYKEQADYYEAETPNSLPLNPSQNENDKVKEEA